MAKVHVSAENAAVPLSAPSVTSRWSQPDNGNADWRGGRYRSTEGRKKNVRVHHFSHYFPLLFLHFYHLNHKKSYLLIKLPCLWSYDIIYKALTLFIAIVTHSL